MKLGKGGIAAALLIVGVIIVTKQSSGPRGIRNNNPGNIREGKDGGIQWNGERVTNDDAAFEEFTDPVYGIRALNRILKTYATKYGLRSVHQIISKWAPSSENNTEAYARTVAKKLGVDMHEEINVSQYALLLTEAIIKHENGVQPYDLDTIKSGVKMGWA